MTTRAVMADEKEAEEAVRMLLELLTPTLGEEIPSVCVVNDSVHPIESVQSAFGGVGDRVSVPDTVGCDEDIYNLSIQEAV